MELSKETKLKDLAVQHLQQLEKLLDMDDSIISLVMGCITKDKEDLSSELRFTSADIDEIRKSAERHKTSCILKFLEEWSTMGGRDMPKMKHLLSVLVKCQLFLAADYVAELINEEKPKRPDEGPAALVDISLGDEPAENIVKDLSYPFSNIDIDVNKNNFMKASPDIPKDINIASSDKTQSTATAKSQIFYEEVERSDLIKFSADNIEIPMTVNSSIESSNYINIPALSAIIQTSNDLETISENIPAFLLSSEQKSNGTVKSDIPDFSGLLNAQSSQQSTYSASDSESYISSIKSE